MYPVCKGQGADIGCGYRKTHPDSIGVDWIKKGSKGKAGNVKGMISDADIHSKGDNLNFFPDNSLDYLVSRHNLEHYQNPRKTLREWIRVIKKGGILGIIVPNSQNLQTYEETHYFNFTLPILNKMVLETKTLNIISIGKCIPNWSFYVIAQKVK